MTKKVTKKVTKKQLREIWSCADNAYGDLENAMDNAVRCGLYDNVNHTFIPVPVDAVLTVEQKGVNKEFSFIYDTHIERIFDLLSSVKASIESFYESRYGETDSITVGSVSSFSKAVKIKKSDSVSMLYSMYLFLDGMSSKVNIMSELINDIGIIQKNPKSTDISSNTEDLVASNYSLEEVVTVFEYNSVVSIMRDHIALNGYFYDEKINKFLN